MKGTLACVALMGLLPMCSNLESLEAPPDAQGASPTASSSPIFQQGAPADGGDGTPADAAPGDLGGGGDVGAAIAETSEPLSTKLKYGVFARLSPGLPPYSMFSSPGVLDAARTKNILDIGATWTRASLSPYFTDQTVFGPGKYDWKAADIVTAWNLAHGIEPVIGIEAGPVQVNDTPGTFSPHEIPRYRTAADFATYCGVAATHFAPVSHVFSIPGNEVNTNPQQFPSVAETTSYMRACYKAVKLADPSAFVYGLELNMDGSAGATAYVKSLAMMGCGKGTCYDGISAHLSLRYPIPPASTPCYPNPGGDYSIACLADLRVAAGAPVPLMIGETVVTWPGMVKDAAAQAIAAPATLRALAAAPGVRYINYANLDECGLYPSGYFMNGCIVDKSNVHVPAWAGVHDVFVGK
ncbi:MAG: hypothetical protein NVS3B20_02510 [Polyangiales bacterium]